MANYIKVLPIGNIRFDFAEWQNQILEILFSILEFQYLKYLFNFKNILAINLSCTYLHFLFFH